MKPSKDPKADELRNKNLSKAKEDIAAATEEKIEPVTIKSKEENQNGEI